MVVTDIKKILYTTDLSENARYALKFASILANRLDAEMTVMHVLEDLPPSSQGLVSEIVGKDRWVELRKRNEEKVIATIKSRIEDVCNEVNDRLPECVIDLQKIVIETGHPVDRIIRHAETIDYDLVVMGSRGQGLLSETMLGGTTNRVLRRCKIPVLVVRLPEDLQDADK